MRRGIAALLAALALAGCGGAATPPGPASVGEAAATALAEPAEGVTVRVGPVTGAPPALGAEIAQAVAARLGPAPSGGARRTLGLVGKVEPAQIADEVLAVDWAVIDEEGATIGSFTSSSPLAPASEAFGWERVSPATVEGVAAGAAQRFRRLPPAKAALEGRPGF